MTPPKLVIIYLYNRLFDPLVQANFWLYIADYLKDPANSIRFHVVSYEDPRFPITDTQQKMLDAWHRQGLEWSPLQWHQGTGIKSKLTDVVNGFAVLLKLRMKGFRYVVSYGSIASAFSYLFGRLLGLRLFIHTFEPHSEYAAENGMWDPAGLMYKAANFLERRAASFAVAIASGTRFMEARLKTDWRVKGKFFKIPSVANTGKFKFNQSQRELTRDQLGLKPDQWVLFYPGKFGSLYYRAETAWMYRWLYQLEPRLHFLIVTPHTDEEIHAIFIEAGVPKDTYTIAHSEYSDIHRYFFAADFAVIAVPPGPSKKFISNIKVGEYLCAGLPYLITQGVSEDSVVAIEQDVGVVVRDFCEADVKAAWPAIKRFLQMDPGIRRAHCRSVGLDYRGFDSLKPVFRAAMSELTRL